MSTSATVSFDINNGDSDDYDCVYSQLEQKGLSRKIKGKNEHTLPSTTLYGEFSGTKEAVLEHVSALVEAAFKHCKVSGKVFVVVGEDTTWAIRYPKGAESGR